MKFDIRLLTKAADEMLTTLSNPRHRAIVANYRRHALLEVSGRFEEILVPSMIVEEPDYWLYNSSIEAEATNIRGMKSVRALYQSLVDTGATVMMAEDEHIWVDDFGFASDATFHTFLPAKVAQSRGAMIDDLDATYIETARYALHWPYDERGRLIGERVFQSVATYRKCPPGELLTVEEVRETLAPLIEPVLAI